MNSQELQNDKLNIIHWISELQDYSVVEKIKSIMNTSKGDTLSMEQKKAIDEAFISIENNGTTSHELVIEQTKKKFSHLFQK